MPTRKKDQKAALDVARILAGDGDHQTGLGGQLLDAILDLSSSTRVHIWHYAVVERALTVMFENMSEPMSPIAGEDVELLVESRQRAYKDIHALIAKINKAAERKEVNNAAN